MSTYTFTAKEVELLIELIATADDTDQDKLAVLSSLSEKLNRKHKRTTGKCGDYWYTDHNGAPIYATKTPPKDFITPNTITIDFNKSIEQELEKKEALVKQAIDNHLSKWSLSSIYGRLSSENYPTGFTVYFLDDKPILEIRDTESRISLSSTPTEFNTSISYRFL